MRGPLGGPQTGSTSAHTRDIAARLSWRKQRIYSWWLVESGHICVGGQARLAGRAGQATEVCSKFGYGRGR